MAIVQISRITNRKGLTENLPQLAGAEFGWCVDSRRLFIGNGTLEEGAPVIGNTEILTQYSDITVLSNYTYQDVAVGYAAQTGPTPSSPVVRTVQEKLDDFASVRDFGAVGDGIADDTEAINRALFQLYCRDNNTQIRRALYFPAGTYRIIESLIIPTYAKLVGEGADCSIIFLDTSGDISSLSAYVARYGDSRQQTGVNIGTNGATPPRNIEISGMTFQTAEDTDIFLVEQATQCWFHSVNFVGPITQQQIEDSSSVPLPEIAGVKFNSLSTNIVNDITFDCCAFTNITYGFRNAATIEGITVSNTRFYDLYQGISLTSGSGTGFRALHNVFDNIYAEGIVYENVNLNVSAYNIFYNVGNQIGSAVAVTPVISFGNDNNVSINDLFERPDNQNLLVPRVRTVTTSASSGGTQLTIGRYTRVNGKTDTIINGGTDVLLFRINSDEIRAFAMDYTIVRTTDYRSGRMMVVSGGDDSTNDIEYTDDYTQNADPQVLLYVTQSANQVSVYYTAQSTGQAGTITYSIAHLA